MELDNFTASMSANTSRDNFLGQGVNHTLPVLWSRGFNVDGVRHRRVKVYIDSNLEICQIPPMIIANSPSVPFVPLQDPRLFQT